MRAVVLVGVAVLAGCTDPSDEVVGPYTGNTYRYVLTEVTLPRTSRQAGQIAGDLDGDGKPENGLGYALSSLGFYDNLTQHGADMIAAGAIASSLEIVADDPRNDSSVGVRYLGTPSSPSVELGGRLADGWFRSNLIAHSAARARAELHLPVFTEADPSLVRAAAMEIMLVPDPDGGFAADIRGAIAVDNHFKAQVHVGIAQMIASDPAEHRTMLALFDTSRDGVVSHDEVWKNSLLISYLAPDIELDGEPMLSFAFYARFRPCASGRCTESVSFDHCFDRLLDGDETALDCGGSCQRCEPGATCAVDDDCESGACESSTCGPPSCTNGLVDGFETDVDCGGPCVATCDLGERCYDPSDCASGQCGRACTDLSCGLGNLGRLDVCYPPP